MWENIRACRSEGGNLDHQGPTVDEMKVLRIGDSPTWSSDRINVTKPINDTHRRRRTNLSVMARNQRLHWRDTYLVHISFPVKNWMSVFFSFLFSSIKNRSWHVPSLHVSLLRWRGLHLKIWELHQRSNRSAEDQRRFCSIASDFVFGTCVQHSTVGLASQCNEHAKIVILDDIV